MKIRIWGVPTVAQRHWRHLCSAKTQVQFPAWYSVLKRSSVCHGLGHNRGPDPIPGPGVPYAAGGQKLKKNKNKTKTEKQRETSFTNMSLTEGGLLLFSELLLCLLLLTIIFVLRRYILEWHILVSFIPCRSFCVHPFFATKELWLVCTCFKRRLSLLQFPREKGAG